jgi:preprotein translocase subunit YajC
VECCGEVIKVFMYQISPFLAQATGAAPSPGVAGMFVPMVCVFVIMYFLVLRPQQQQRKKLQEMVDNMKTGDAVVTTGGIHGIVSNMKDGNTLMLKIADNVRIEVDKSAIASVLKEVKVSVEKS